MVGPKITGDLGRRLTSALSAERFAARVDGVSFLIALIMAVLLAVLAIRSAVRLDIRWDAPWYHFPFAAHWAGLHVPHEPTAYIRHYFEGFPPLPQMVQGLLWRLTGSINATGTVNFLAFATFLLFCASRLRAPFWLVAMIALTAPMVLIHTTVSYVDLFANSWLAIGVSAFAYAWYYRKVDDTGLFFWAMGGLAAAAWSKFLMAPLVAVFLVAFFVLYATAHELAPPVRRRRLWIVAAVALIAALPYLKNLVLYGNPFWPMQVPFLGELLPYKLNAGEIELSQTPPPLRGAGKLTLFFHSLFEINHPTSYPHRLRWIIDQGNAWLAFRMGGLWGTSVAVFLISAAVVTVAVGRWRGLLLTAGMLATILFVGLLPQSFVSRYYLFMPLCWAAIIGMTFPAFRRRFPRSALALLLLFLGQFVYVTDINRPYYKIEKIGFEKAARDWGAAAWWPRLKRGVTYCAVGMEPIGFFLTGPTLSEYRIVDRKKQADCPAGTTVIRNPDAPKRR